MNTSKLKRRSARKLTVVADFASNTCSHRLGRVFVQCDCVGGEIGFLSEYVQRLQRQGMARIVYGVVDLSFL